MTVQRSTPAASAVQSSTPAASAEHVYPADAPVLREDLEQCAATLRSLRGKCSREDDGFAFYESVHCREVRKALAPFAQRMQRKMFQGGSRSAFEEKKALKREAEGRIAQKRMFDQNHIDKAAIRFGRAERLAELKRQGEHLPLVADGAVTAPEALESSSNGLAELNGARACYTCKRRFYVLHHFYSDLCPECAALNWQKRSQRCDCNGKVALVTGGRVKIGFQVVVKLLRWGAHVIVTTRFPQDCARRLAAQAQQEGADWAGRLDVYGLDFRDISSLEVFCGFCVQHYHRLDILINNACQTIRRPTAFYRHLLEGETAQHLPSEHSRMLQGFQEWRASYSQAVGLSLTDEGGEGDVAFDMARSAAMSQIALVPEDSTSQFPAGVLDTNGQQVDLRTRNTWIMKMDEIETAEVAEVFLINAMAPFILNSRLQRLMERGGAGDDKFIVNVSAMEGKFYRTKAPYHPHTNMAKAALNQLTRTAAGDLAKRRIYMCAVDTGWINDENPLEKAKRYSEQHHFQCPLDEVDAAARILDPVVVALSGGRPLFDVFLKDYAETEW